MCVAMPGKIMSIGASVPGAVMGLVDFGDRTLEINLIMLPDVKIGDHILVHSGFAIRMVREPFHGLHTDSGHRTA